MESNGTDKEEMKRKLEEMKLKYAKIERKLSKSGRRRSAKIHVRRIVAEQGNGAASPEFSPDTDNDSKKKNSIDDGEDWHEDGKSNVEGDSCIKRQSGRRGRSLRKSISFKLEDSIDENGIPHGERTHGDDNIQSRISHELVRIPKEIDENRSREMGKACDLIGKKDRVDGESLLFKVSRLSHCKKSRRWKSKTGLETNSVNIVDRSSCGSPYVDVPLSGCHAHSEPLSKSDKEQDLVSGENKLSKVPGDIQDCACLRWKGIFKGGDSAYRQDAWDGVHLHHLGVCTVALLYRSNIAVLWVHMNNWEARSQWQLEDSKSSVISDVRISSHSMQLSIIFNIKKDTLNELSIVTYNLEDDSEDVRDVTMPTQLQEAEKLRIILHGDGGAVMSRTMSHLYHIHLFLNSCSLQLMMWQVDGLKNVQAVSFIPVEGAPNLYLSLSSNQLSLWSHSKKSSLLDVILEKSMSNVVNECLWSKAEGGLLFFIALKQPSTLSLCVLNPATSVVVKVHSFMLSCAYHSLRVMDVSINCQFLAAVYSNKKTLIWDIYSGRPIAEIATQENNTREIVTTSGFLIINGKDSHLYEIDSDI